MKRKSSSQLDPFASGTPPTDILYTDDVIRVLKQTATLFRRENTGNQVVHKALSGLVRVLQRYSDRPFQETLLVLQRADEEPRHSGSRRGDEDNCLDVSSLTSDQIRSRLAKKALTKQELVAVGDQRFGIPKAGLEKQSRDALIETITAALDHEESIKILSEQAKRGGRSRSS